MALTKISGSILKDPLNLGEVSIGGTLTYQDVTNVDSVGIGTFRTGINVRGGQLDVGSNIKLGNAGVVTATSFVGDGSNLTGLAADKIFEGNTKAEVSDTGTNGRFFVEIEGTERFSINSIGYATFSGALTGFQGATFAQDLSIVDTIKHTGDTDTRIRFPANDTISFQTGGGERVRIDASGRVLIGRTTQLASSAERLTIDDGMAMFRRSSTNAAAVYIRNEDSTADTRHPYLIFTDGSGNRGGFGIQNDSSSLWISGQNGIVFRTSGSAPSQNERLRISSTGQFVVGTNPTVNSGNIAHIEAPTSFNSGETIIAVVGDNATAGPRLLLQNKNTGGSAHGEILGTDAGGQSTSSIRFYNTDQSNNYGEIAFGTRNQSGVPPEDRMRIESDGQLVVHGGGTKYAGWAGGTPLNVTSMAMINVGNAGTSNWGWGLRGNSGDTQWCLERIKDNSGFNDVYIKFRVYNNGNYLFAGSNSSDRDLKENILDITGTSLDKIKQLRPRTFNFIESEGYSTETKTGFIAQEVASVIPSITNGTDGQKNMGVDYNGLVAHLVKALQEATTEIETLKTKVAALEGS